VKEFLSQLGVAFIERDVTSDDEALEELEKLQVLTTPVVVVDDEVIVGFDKSKLLRALDREKDESR
jgi:glutaredoxin